MRRRSAAVLISLTLAVPAVAWAAAGDLDPTFGNGGIVRGTSGWIAALVVQPDGKVVAVGSTAEGTALGRYNADGSVDTTFGTNGLAILPSSPVYGGFASALVLQPDGKLVAGGALGKSQTDQDFALVRCNPDGTLDSTFGSNGVVVTPITSQAEYVTTLALQPDGKLLAAGYALSPAKRFRFGVVRYNPDGSLDRSFGRGGIVLTQIGLNDYAETIVAQPDGRIVVAGTSCDAKRCTSSLERLTSAGRRDYTFGRVGIVRSIANGIEDLVLQPDGKLVGLGPESGVGGYLQRYNTDGTLDTTFGAGGVSSANFVSGGHALVRRANGTFAVLGTSASVLTPRDTSFRLSRYTADGNWDSLYGSDGVMTTNIGTDWDWPTALVQQPDGKLVAGGTSRLGSGIGDWVLVRYQDGDCGSGSVDPGEECDDGNLTDADGCDANCTVTRCGNGVVTAGEECDDGNNDDHDGCKSNCTLNTCGDAVVRTGIEQCDDGNAIEDDGCNSVCVRVGCGDGVLGLTEECDDGNTVNGDGCDSSCRTELCGNGRVEGNEACDDGNTVDGDGCQANCTWSLVYDAVLSSIRMPIAIQLTATRAEVNKDLRLVVRDGAGPLPSGHTIRLVSSDGDCPAGTVAQSPNDSVSIHVTRTAFPNATKEIPQRCTLTFSVHAEPQDVTEPTPENNVVSVELNVLDGTVPSVATQTRFVLRSLNSIRATILRGWDSLPAIVSLDVTTAKSGVGTPQPTREISITIQDGTCPSGMLENGPFVLGTLGTTIAGRPPRSRAHQFVNLTLSKDGFHAASANSPARCTALVTATSPGVDSEAQQTTRLTIDVVDQNDF
ncbi:MAG: DUF4215 domain-containing protein [Deltaproteobacteria bacterium]|nr:DUF4215 domain-containing protein [Deltaproteobacteria bacterium]MBI3387489.1 DUF4215 domain-containing protein [Deltaproteobacteria bacterium]